MPPATARQLLTHMKWNLDRLIECYYGGEAEDLFTKGGIADPRNADSAMVRFLSLLGPSCPYVLPFSSLPY